MATNSPLARCYNDTSPLENHHCALAFAVLEKPHCNFLEGLEKPLLQVWLYYCCLERPMSLNINLGMSSEEIILGWAWQLYVLAQIRPQTPHPDAQTPKRETQISNPKSPTPKS